MAKPRDAVELPLAFDLSEVAYERAREKLVELMGEAGWFAAMEKPHFSSFYALRIPSQLIGQAMVLRMYAEFYIEPSLTYGPDEWSLHAKIWDDKKREWDELIVWSPGA